MLARTLNRVSFGYQLRTALPVTAIFLGTFLLQNRVVAQPTEARSKAPDNQVVDNGLVFVNGQPIPRPYEVRYIDNALTINGTVIDFGIAASDSGLDEEERTGRRAGFIPEGRPGRFRRAEKRDALGRRLQERIVFALEEDEVIVAFDQCPAVFVNQGTELFDFTSALLASAPDEQQVNNFKRLAVDDDTRERLAVWLQNAELPDAARRELTDRFNRLEASAAENERRIAAVHRLDRLNYPLTIAGMLFGVLALGHMLKWAARGMVDDEGSVQSSKAAEKALLLILAMSAIDLIWTVLAGQAGVMTELNPIAKSMMDSPAKLALFKVAATGLGIGILYTWRHRSQIQQATWWMCLVCVLLTFRWVMFDSMMS